MVWTLGIIVFGGLIILAVFYLAHLYEKNRTDSLREIAESLHFQFVDQSRARWFATGGLPLFSLGRATKISNIMLAEGDDETVYIFDYRYTVGHGKHAHTYKQTVVCFESQQLNLPKFEMRPETLLHKLGSLLGGHDIDFPAYRQFSSRYNLRGEREAEIRQVFHDQLLHHLENTSGLALQGNRHTLIYFRSTKRVPARELKEFLRDAYTIYVLLKNAAPEAGSGEVDSQYAS